MPATTLSFSFWTPVSRDSRVSQILYFFAMTSLQFRSGWVSISGRIHSLSSRQLISPRMLRRRSTTPVPVQLVKTAENPAIPPSLHRPKRLAYRRIQCKAVKSSRVRKRVLSSPKRILPPSQVAVPVRIFVDHHLYNQAGGKKGLPLLRRHIRAALAQASELFRHKSLVPKVWFKKLQMNRTTIKSLLRSAYV